jgi:hypothetical protein
MTEPGAPHPRAATPAGEAPPGADATPAPPPGQAPPAGEVPPAVEAPVPDSAAVRVAGGVVAVALAVVTALIEIFYTPLRVGGVLVGASIVLAVVVNFYLPRFTVAATGVGWVALLPPLAWFVLSVAAAGRRGEGDILLTNWVGLGTVFAGSIAFAAGGYRLMVPPRQRSF